MRSRAIVWACVCARGIVFYARRCADCRSTFVDRKIGMAVAVAVVVDVDVFLFNSLAPMKFWTQTYLHICVEQ